MQTADATVRVWDPFVRIFHWTLVLTFAGAWITAEASASWHERLGYLALALVGLRVVWGLVGTHHARFSDFVRGPSTTFRYLRDLVAGRASHYLGHNPAGGWMVIGLLCGLLLTSITGLVVEDEHSFWGEVHEVAANLTVMMVAVHVAGVIIASRLHGENLVRAMITGSKPRRVEHD